VIARRGERYHGGLKILQDYAFPCSKIFASVLKPTSAKPLAWQPCASSSTAGSPTPTSECRSTSDVQLLLPLPSTRATLLPVSRCFANRRCNCYRRVSFQTSNWPKRGVRWQPIAIRSSYATNETLQYFTSIHDGAPYLRGDSSKKNYGP
jgi:hypothetical protein